MKLGDLRGAIRKPGNPTMVIDLGNGVPMTIAFQKTPLLEELGKAFSDDRTAETGLSYDPATNLLTVDGFVGQEDEDQMVGGGYLDDEEDAEPMSPVADRDPGDDADEDDDLL